MAYNWFFDQKTGVACVSTLRKKACGINRVFGKSLNFFLKSVLISVFITVNLFLDNDVAYIWYLKKGKKCGS